MVILSHQQHENIQIQIKLRIITRQKVADTKTAVENWQNKSEQSKT